MDIEIQLLLDKARLILLAGTRGQSFEWQDLSIEELRQLKSEIEKVLLEHEVNRQIRPIRLAGHEVIEAPSERLEDTLTRVSLVDSEA